MRRRRVTGRLLPLMAAALLLAGCAEKIEYVAPKIDIKVVRVQNETDADQSAEVEEEAVETPVIPDPTEVIEFDPSWEYADMSAVNDGKAVMYRAQADRRDIVIGVNAGHGTKGGSKAKTYSHPDQTPKVTGGTNPKGAVKSMAISDGMKFRDGTREAAVTLQEAQILKDKLLEEGFDVLMLRDEDDVQLDNVARTVMCNNLADCHIALHWDGDGLGYDKGCFFTSTPDGIKKMEPVASTWEKSEELGEALIEGLSSGGCKICGNGSMDIDLTQTSYSSIPSVDMELGNAASAHDEETLGRLADGLVSGIKNYFDKQ